MTHEQETNNVKFKGDRLEQADKQRYSQQVLGYMLLYFLIITEIR